MTDGSFAASTATAVGRACPYCGASALYFFCEGHDRLHHTTDQAFLYDRCTSCGAVVMRDPPSMEQLVRFYPETYAPHAAHAQNHRDWSDLSFLSARGSVAEIGCGSGDALADFAMFRPQWTLTGIDLSERAIAAAKKRLPGAHLASAELMEWLANAPSGAFDLVICEHVIEHVHDPAGLFRHLLRVLSPQGTLLLSIPNAGSWTMRIFRAAAHHLEAPRHLMLPSHRSIRALCVREGGVITRHRGQAYPSVFFRSLSEVMPGVSRLMQTFRVPSLLRIISAPFTSVWTAPFSKLTYLIRRHTSSS